MRDSWPLIVSTALLALSAGRPALAQAVPVSQAEAGLSKADALELSKAIREGNENALRQLRGLAEVGVAEAQVTLAAVYANIPERRDPTESAKWYLAAALQGLPVAQASVGHCYARGLGVEKDLEQGKFWLEMAADQGQWLAAGTLGDVYRGPHPEEPGDFVQAYRWYTVGARVLAEAGRKDILESMLTRRAQIAERMGIDQVAEGEALAAHWVRRDWSELKARLEHLR